MTTNEERIRNLEDENERLRSQLEDWKEKAAELEMAPPPEVKMTMKISREEQIAIHVAETIARIQAETMKKVHKDTQAERRTFIESSERRNELLEAALDVEKEHSPAYELWRIRKAVESLTGENYAD